MAVWTDLPLHILEIIVGYLTLMEDFASFSVVSKECQLVIARWKKKPSLPPRYPRLMLAENKKVPVLGFVNLLTSKTFEVELSQAMRTYCVGAHYGWLFALGSDLQINLLHPFSKQQICLPPMLTFPNQYNYDEEFTPQNVLDVFVRKIAMSASPLKGNNLNDECVIVAIYGELRILAFARLGDTVWTNIQVPASVYDDVIYYKGKFYAISVYSIVICDIDDNNSPKATVVVPAPSGCSGSFQKYLVESCGDLLLVCRRRRGRFFEVEDDDEERDFYDWERECDDDDNEDNQHNDENSVDYGGYKEKKDRYYTTGFSISRLEKDNKNDYPWSEVTNLGDRALFLGRNVSTSVVASKGVKGNCIYFTDDDDIELYNGDPGGGGHDTGVFNMEDGSIQFGYAGKSRSRLSPPIWYI